MNRNQVIGFIIASGLAFFCGLGFAINTLSEKSITADIKLESKINPNVAAVSALMLLPSVGPARAHAIINYREQFQQNNPGRLAFNNCNDLDNVKGIGPVTIGNLCEHLKFEKE